MLLREGKVIREINRSDNHADAYEFPICFAQLAGGREVLIHCPEEYCRIDIDDAETGERLTDSAGREPAGFFHSRLAVSNNQKYLMSAGWVWHPFGTLGFFSLERAISDPKSLDSPGWFGERVTEVASAAFLNDRCVLVSTSELSFSDGEYGPDDMQPISLYIWDIPGNRFESSVPVGEPMGTLMPIDDSFAVSFYNHPKIVDLRTGEISSRMPDLNTGKQVSSIVHHITVPVLALDASNKRFAVATENKIVVVGVVE